MYLTNLYRFERWEKIGKFFHRVEMTESENIVVTEGLNEIQTEFWKGSAYTAGLFVGLIPTTSFSAVALTDTAAQINGSNAWVEFSGYSETVRQTLSMGTAVGGALDSSASQAIFTVTSAFSLQGGFVATSSVKGGTTGKLIGATSAPSIIAYAIGQQVRITVSSTLSN